MLTQQDKLKTVLFNKAQKSCLEFIDKPNLYKESELHDVQENVKESTIKKAEELINYFKPKISENQMTELDNKSYSILSAELKNLIIN